MSALLLAAATGRCRMTLRLPGLAIELIGDERWREALAFTYGDFLAVDAPAPDEAFELALEIDPAAPAPEVTTLEPPEVEREGDLLRVRGAAFSAEVDLARRQGWIVGPCDRYPVDLVIRQLLAAKLVDGLVLHAALAVEHGRSVACAGPSGSGKSTLARLLGERARCDELCALRRVNGHWQGHALPYWNGAPASAPLARILLLAHGREEQRRRPLAPREAMRRLAQEVVWPAGADASASAFASLAALVGEVAVDELAFLPDASVMPWVLGEPAAAVHP